MRALDIKLLRDLKRLWAQALAIVLVVAAGVAALVAMVGTIRSLEETRDTYYERYQFADVFAQVKRAPKNLIGQIAEIPGVAAVDARIVKLVLLDIPDSREPVTAQFISIPDNTEQHFNRIYLRSGRTPEPGRAEEVVVYEAFAVAHKMQLGSHFSAILNGRKRELVVVGTAMSPEFIYTIGPGETITDNRRFGIIWMSEKALANVYNLNGAFSSVTLRLLRNASEADVIKRLDARFASAQHLELFKADPDRYAPQYGGSCAAAITVGVKIEAEPENWLIVDGKLFVFAGAAGGPGVDKMRAHPAEMIAKGRENWKTLADAPYR